MRLGQGYLGIPCNSAICWKGLVHQRLFGDFFDLFVKNLSRIVGLKSKLSSQLFLAQGAGALLLKSLIRYLIKS